MDFATTDLTGLDLELVAEELDWAYQTGMVDVAGYVAGEDQLERYGWRNDDRQTCGEHECFGEECASLDH